MLCARRLRGEVEVADGRVRLGADGEVSFDTYLNSFYESFWREHTLVHSLAVQAFGSGRVTCNVFREAGGSVALIASAELDLDLRAEARVEVRPGAPAPKGARLFLQVEALGPAMLHHLAWVTDDAPEREVRLGVGACTFNREHLIIPTLEVLLGAAAGAAVERLVVVNQGAPLCSAAIRALQAAEPRRLQVIEQANFGGAGGFTRAILELMADCRVTHVLLMDDDIRLDPIHLATAVAFLRYARRQLVVGGQMLDMIDPTTMFEAGAMVTPDNLLEACHRDLDLTLPASLSALSEVLEPDFNGWWFSIIPVECFSRQGLPLPIFIRGDDQEYGVRLREAGVATISLPPVSVWHEPFYTRPPGWQLYYDLRNRLIFASMHPDRFRLDTPVYLLKRLWAAIIRYDYQQAEIIILATRDFLKGPDLLREQEPSLHERVKAELARCAPLKLDGPSSAEPSREEPPTSRSVQRLHLVFGFVRAVIGYPAGGRKERLFFPEMPLEFMRLGKSYVFGGSQQSFFLRYTHSRRATWRQICRTVAAIGRYARLRRTASQAWRREQPHIVSHAAWSLRLGLSES